MEDSKELREYKLFQEKKRSFRKHGPKVFHLQYQSTAISKGDLIEFEEGIKSIDGEFGSYDTVGDITASLENFTLDVYLVFSQITLTSIISNSINSATWDTIKYTMLKIWKRTKDSSTRSQNFNARKLSVGFQAKLQDNNIYDFKLEGELTSKEVDKSLDKFLDFIRKEQLNKRKIDTHFVQYDNIENEWKIVDIEAEIRKKYFNNKKE